jgi:hypothetical protein
MRAMPGQSRGRHSFVRITIARVDQFHRPLNNLLEHLRYAGLINYDFTPEGDLKVEFERPALMKGKGYEEQVSARVKSFGTDRVEFFTKEF